ncbi:MAG TPA: lecithin retinol acyltransferase family protein [Nitrospira sp.]|nr:lecithin retinol acyltransferase family protein [Nitrospira sp.]
MPSAVGPVVPALLCPGTVIFIWLFPFFRHRGIVSDRYCGDKPMVISNSARAGGVIEEPWDAFAAGQSVQVEGYPSRLAPWIVVQRARDCVGTRYSLVNWNCDHLVSDAHGLVTRSPQVALVIAVALIAGLFVMTAD